MIRRAVFVALASLAAARRPRAGRAAAPQTSVPYALLVDFDSGATLFAKNADAPMSPASTTKILTAEIVFRRRRRPAQARRIRADLAARGARGRRRIRRLQHVRRRPNSQVRIDDLLRGLRRRLGQRRGDRVGRARRRLGRSLRRPDEPARPRAGDDPLAFRQRLGRRQPAPDA